ncbi:hypothetical protein [Sulfurimonas lithotrophica]|uniref:hypothetical protein n=1 Tax=Sulfurimonas lithotrophica TaxID=2590022 RepID=UPI00165FF1B9|nr:hypothetical protein [Sulfurimonas lithotrophica]
MIAFLKRFGVALIFLTLVIILMIGGTLGVKSFGDKMFEDVDVKMKPRGERLNK